MIVPGGNGAFRKKAHIDMKHVYDDGGREAAGYKGKARDCAVRAIAIATGKDYQDVYDSLYAIGGESPRDGVPRKTYQKYLEALGWTFTATMGIGTGCTTHLVGEELPRGRIIVRCSKHLTAVVDGVIRDTYDCSRGGTRCVYGYWQKTGEAAA